MPPNSNPTGLRKTRRQWKSLSCVCVCVSLWINLLVCEILTNKYQYTFITKVLKHKKHSFLTIPLLPAAGVLTAHSLVWSFDLSITFLHLGVSVLGTVRLLGYNITYGYVTHVNMFFFNYTKTLTNDILVFALAWNTNTVHSHRLVCIGRILTTIEFWTLTKCQYSITLQHKHRAK